jgi:hypothetical protein
VVATEFRAEQARQQTAPTSGAIGTASSVDAERVALMVFLSS